MKHILLFGLLLAFTASCKNSATPSPEENVKDREVKRLLEEASALWSPSADSTFSFNDNKTERISVNDKKIWTKLDSALTIDPHNIKVYLGRTTYLMSCKKFHKILPILREAEKKHLLTATYGPLKRYSKIITEIVSLHKRIIVPQIPLMPSSWSNMPQIR